MDEQMMGRLEAIFLERSNRAFGDVDAVSGRTLQPISFGLMAAAQNLLAKALRHWRSDRPRALGYVGRATRLPFDDHEQQVPVLAAAGALLFDLLVDEVEASDDDAWLHAAIALLKGTDGPARFVLADQLQAIDQDWELPADEGRVIRAAVAPIPPHPPLWDLWDLTPGETRDLAAGILDICIGLDDTLSQFEGTET